MRRMRAMVVPEGIATLVSGWAVRLVQPKPWGQHSPECPRQPRQPWPSPPRGPTKACGLKCKGTKVKQRCWNPCWNPLLEPLSALEPSAATLLEPPFCAGIPARSPAGTPLSALEPLLEPTFVRFSSFLENQHLCGPSQPRRALDLGHYRNSYSDS